MPSDLSFYLNVLTSLKRATVETTKAPHKPVLILSVIDLIRTKHITENKIFISPELVARFNDNWKAYVTQDYFTPNFSLPFFHLRSETFWNLQTKPGRQFLLTKSHSIKSLSSLNDTIDYAYLEEELYNLLQQQTEREALYQHLKRFYFNDKNEFPITEGLFYEIEAQILNDEPQTAIYKTGQGSEYEEEIFIRSGVFKKIIPQQYNYTCAITGLRVNSIFDIQMIDACHIIPFSLTHDCSISNGLSLCPNMHRAYDRGLISITPDYKVVLSPHFSNNASTHSFEQFDGKKILLPKEEKHFPGKVNLEWHLNQRFLN